MNKMLHLYRSIFQKGVSCPFLPFLVRGPVVLYERVAVNMVCCFALRDVETPCIAVRALFIVRLEVDT